MKTSAYACFVLLLLTSCSGRNDSPGGNGADDCVDEDADGAGQGCSLEDCDDGDADVHPKSVEVPGNTVDEDCSGAANDQDGDGYDAVENGGNDCDDRDADINPDASEIFGNAVDEDCSGMADGSSGTNPDADDDGYDAVSNGGDDCDDDNPDAYPGGTEVGGNTVDEDCSGAANDQDGDGHDSIENGEDDCDDDDPDVSPAGSEVEGNTVDEDCSGAANDVDGDGHDATDNGGDDCDDSSNAVHPGADGVGADGIDQNCDGHEECFRDADLDGHGDDSAELLVDLDDDMDCETGFNQSDDDDDCNDDDPLTYFGAQEIPDDQVDQDCDSSDSAAVTSTGLFVDGDGTCDDLGLGTKDEPMCTIQAAVSASLAGTKVPVFVAVGTYVEDVTTQVDVHGGYDPATWTRSATDRSQIESTGSVNATLTTSGTDPVALSGLNVTGSDGAFSDRYAVVMNAPGRIALCDVVGDEGGVAGTTYGIDVRKAPAIISDTTIDGGLASSGVNSTSRAINVNSGGTLSVVRATIENASSSPTVIGLISHNASGEVSLFKTIIDFDTTTKAKGIYLDRGSLRVDRSFLQVVGSATSLGVETSANAGTIEIFGTVLRIGPVGSNPAQGAGVQILGSTAPVLLAHNSIECFGGSICTATQLNSVSALLYNNYLNGGDSTNFQDRTIALVTPGDITVQTNDVVTGMCYISGTACVSALDGPATPALNSCDWTGCSAAGDNISQDPDFSDAAYHVNGASPLCNSGTNLSILAPVRMDIDGELRGEDGSWDIGVDEYVP